ncbi:Plasmodium exported protein, unknown function [Plasmodium malariae]|uniref:Uncharacterized protein n=1 Tax=Plasmodium malariae TaxID=5858 RepID=A0A1D3TDK8_PLAMA|nr:Plasmodium exported protein, unknown function [Plasmodium malariae]SCP02992.1 Plasmodium exported protein, unknown function [Plasmodium malariae]
MEQTIMLPYYIRICLFILLSCISHFHHDMSTFNKYLAGRKNIDETLDTITYRLLAKYKHEKGPIIARLKKDIPTINEYSKMCVSSNGKVEKGKNKRTNQCLLNNIVEHGHTNINKSSVYSRRNSHFEKRMLDKIYYKNKVRHFTNADFLFLKNDIKVNKSFICAVTIYHLFVSIIGSVLLLCTYKNLQFKFTLDWGLGLGILGCICVFIVILIMIYLHRQILKYGKIRHIKSELHNTAYPSH